ncbi:hypothetical protein HC248_03120 [Polaromonas vacuolata]|uniref:YgjP-like metallopeptidase domain-containing protein n=1 Tax=Polaromonas vacuolata TaxID=37448 RepID=A0A6H2HD26_9BURK|nr:SprT family zinc-dependent metalloprotease [Polaromonas vacuolata]QJC57789.1 hypothetical protein HC248_03120 [Polaromonas vacuolata]
MHRLYQFTLDFFGASPIGIPVVAPVKHLAQAPSPIPLLLPIASAPAQPILPTQTQVLASFSHPRATRSICLKGLTIGYEFKRGKRLTIGFSVGPDGLAVRAPKWVPLADVDTAVLDKADWIVKKLHESQARHQRLESSRIEWKDGASLPFLGEPITLVLDSCHAFLEPGAAIKKSLPRVELFAFSGQNGEDQGRQELHIGLSSSASAEQIRDAVQAWLMRQAKSLFIERLNHFAPALNVQWRKLSLSNASTRWGSASADGSLRLNWRLIHFKPAVIDYVVVHELSHLRVMDHSPLFWATVAAIVPDYAVLRGQLKIEGMPLL